VNTLLKVQHKEVMANASVSISFVRGKRSQVFEAGIEQCCFKVQLLHCWLELEPPRVKIACKPKAQQ
jgi:hypothetical protein